MHYQKLLKGLDMHYHKIDVYLDNCGRSTRNKNKHLKCGKTRYTKVINDDGETVTMEVAQKQICYMPFAPKLK